MFARLTAAISVGAAALLLAGKASAFSVLIVNGMSASAESSTTRDITWQLNRLSTEAGNSVSVADTVPTDLSGYDQVWDLRFNGVGTLSGAERDAYLDLLDDGKGLFLMGENPSHRARNNSLLSFVEAAGGGSLGTRYVSDRQVVADNFSEPYGVLEVEYASSEGVDGTGTGEWITYWGRAGSGVAWETGTLNSSGTLAMMLDANFMQSGGVGANENLVRNLIAFMDDSVSRGLAPVPVPAPIALLGLGLVSLFGLRARRKA